MTELCAPASAVAVVNQFIKFSQAEPQFSMDQMKLQKLLFYAHAWHLAYNKGPLFENDFEAWPWGPVVRDVYLQTKDCGRGRLTDYLSEVEWQDGAAVFNVPDGVENAETRAFLNNVWDTMKSYSGVQLSNSTHAPGEPWTLISDTLGTRGKPMIPNDLIEAVYKRKLEAASANSAT